MQKLETIRYTWRFLSVLSPFWRLHQVVRSLLIPFHKIISYLPEQGILLDLGCGHGLFLALARREKPNLHLMGIDVSEGKITAARKAFQTFNNTVPQLTVIDINDLPEQSVDVISIIDVLYLVPIDRWDSILKKCYHCLKPGGRLLLKEMDRSHTWKLAVLYLEETLAVKMLGLTLGKQFTFPEREEIRRRLSYAGFDVEEIPIHRGYPVPHHLWIGTKPKS
jgi:ubiquinone/menaquinone biosynthesis C-methylase UbiE